MSLEQGKIGNSQFILLMIGYIIGPSIVLVPGSEVKQDAWLAILVSICGGMFLFFFNIILSLRFKGKSLIQINEVVYGPVFSKLISLFYIWFIFHVGTLVLATFKDFFKITTLPQTPMIITTVLIILTCAYAVNKGIEVIARCGQILVLTAIFSFFGSSLLLLKDMDINNLLPVFEMPVKNLLMTAFASSVFLYGDTIVFFMVIPYLESKNSKRFIKSVAIAFIFSGFFLSIMALRNIGILGPMNGVFIFPTFQADRLINIGNLLTRLEILTVTGFLTMGFINLSIILYAVVLGVAQLCSLRTYKPITLIISILMALIALINFESITGNLFFAQRIYLYYALPFQVGIPLLTLIVALIRKLPKKMLS